MQEETNILKKAIETLLSKIESTEKFVLDQAPEVCQQLIKESYVTNLMDCVAEVFQFILGVLGCFLFFNIFKKYDEADIKFLIVVGIFGLGMFSLINLRCVHISILNLICLKIAPKVFLIRKFKDLM